MTIFEMAMQYYPRLWNDARLEALFVAGKLTSEELEEIKNNSKWNNESKSISQR